MNRFLKYVALFGLVCFATLVAGEFIVRQLPNQYRYKKSWMDKNASAVEILILGHSQAYYGIKPSMLGAPAFNLANVSQTFKYDYLLLENYIDRCARLTTVVLPVTYSSFFDKEMDYGDEWGYTINYKIYMGVDVHSDLSKYNFEISNFPVYAGKLRSIYMGSNLSWDELGHGEDFGSDKRVVDLEESALTAAKRHTATDWSSVNDNMRWLRKIIELCAKRSIRLVLVTPPVSQAYYQRLDSKQLSAMRGIIHSLVGRYGLSYYDYSAAKGFEDVDFYDADHLTSDVGAAKFTSMLAHDVCDCDSAIVQRP